MTDYYSLPSSENTYMVTVRDLAVTNALVLSSNIQNCGEDQDTTLPVITINGIYSFLLSASYDYDIIVAVSSTASVNVNYSLIFDMQGNGHIFIVGNVWRSDHGCYVE